jgi:hypothetical protein
MKLLVGILVDIWGVVNGNGRYDMSKLFNKHIKLVEAVNATDTLKDYARAMYRLEGFRLALEVLNINQLSDCDRYYMERGIDRDMCCGVWLDKERS